ncbi:MAG: hypothetical protein OEY33_09720 [Bdellovibrionales bacterium]|jgi:hypothetical protein|nr:hypothetical protein [Bdellovibrionales bacterium]
MLSVKRGMIILLCFYVNIGEANDVKNRVEGAINHLSELIKQKYQLSTTGYQTAMSRKGIFMTLKRGEEYTSAAKKMYPVSTLKKLALLQKNYINKSPVTGELKSPHHFVGDELSDALVRVRNKNFANCEMQNLEAAIHIYALGFKNLAIISNKAISHNYLLLEPSNLWPRGAIVDPWTGFDLRELDFKLRAKYKHFSKDIMVPKNIMDWLKKNAHKYVNKAWISRIRKKYFPGEGPEPLKNKLKPIESR